MNETTSAAQGRLAGKIAFITGIAGGQGREAALEFARQGATVFGCDLDAAGAEETLALAAAAHEPGYGTVSSQHPVDLMAPGAPAAWIEEGVGRHGRIDVLYNNAAAVRMRRIGDPDALEAFEFTIRGELIMVFDTIRAAWPHFVRGGGGSIVSTSSTAAVQGMPVPVRTPGSSAGHSAAKAGILGLSLQVAAEGAPHRIRSNAILPGFIEAPVTAPIIAEPGAREQITASIPLRRIGRPSDIALAAVYLASDESEWMTGETLTIDGGVRSLREEN